MLEGAGEAQGNEKEVATYVKCRDDVAILVLVNANTRRVNKYFLRKKKKAREDKTAMVVKSQRLRPSKARKSESI